MKVITDNPEFVRTFIRDDINWHKFDSSQYSSISMLAARIFAADKVYGGTAGKDSMWQYLVVSESSECSQYDLAIEQNQNGPVLPDGILCLAGEGKSFHGFRNRPWAAPPGNIYLTVSFSPERKIENFGVGFLTLAAVSVVDALDNILTLKGRAGIKWVNDILIDDAKVCGVLAHTQQEGDKVTAAVLGIGLNVLTAPDIEPTPFVPKVTSLADCAADNDKIGQAAIFHNLIGAIEKNYTMLLSEGYKALLDTYRQRSIIIGRNVEVCLDLETEDTDTLRCGRAKAIGDSLELYIEGCDRAITRGRLILK